MFPVFVAFFVVDYSLFYTTRGTDLLILSVRDNRRDPEVRPYGIAP